MFRSVTLGWCLVVGLVSLFGVANTGFGQEFKADVPRKLVGEGMGQASWVPEIVVRLTDAADPEQVALRHRLRLVRSLGGAEFYLMEPLEKVPNAGVELQGWLAELREDPEIVFCAQNRRVHKQRGFEANDTFFGPNRLGGQWHLKNELTSIDANVTEIWSQGATGLGVVIGIVDDGLPITHPDLSPNLRLDLSYDFGQNDSDPSPVRSGDNHGASVAGVAAARGGNEIGVTGAAPYASLSGLRIDFSTSTAADFAAATLFQSAAIPIKNHSYGFGDPFIDDSIQSAAVAATPETVHCFAAGNERDGANGDSGKQQVHNLANTINVAAIASNGRYSSYSCFGANIIVTAPSNGVLGITTTDRVGTAGYNSGFGSGDYQNSDGPNAADYTASFGGTSSAAPLVAGVLALAYEANPAMDYRMANHLLVRTGVKVDPNDNTATSDGGWRANGAGFEFNQNYGFGMIDAGALVDAATAFSGVTPLATQDTGVIQVNRTINENSPVTVHFTLDEEAPLEDLFVRLNVTHTFRGDLSAFVTSPSGFRSRLFVQSGADVEANLNWTFRTVAFWGENAEGRWTLELIDNFAVDSGTFRDFQVSANFGTLIPSYVLGDANGDGFFDFGDLEPFVMALAEPERYAITYPHVDPNRVLDFDGDGWLTFGDIEGFVNGLLGG